MSSPRDVPVARLADLPPGRLAPAEVDGMPVVLARVGDAVHACGAVPTYAVRIEDGEIRVDAGALRA